MRITATVGGARPNPGSAAAARPSGKTPTTTGTPRAARGFAGSPRVSPECRAGSRRRSRSVGCAPDESPFRQENENLRKQLAKQESVMNSLQDGNKVMQQQIDLLNQELRDARKQTEQAQAEAKALQAEAKALGTKLDSQLAESKKLSGEIQRTARSEE